MSIKRMQSDAAKAAPLMRGVMWQATTKTRFGIIDKTAKGCLFRNYSRSLFLTVASCVSVNTMIPL